MNNKARRRSWPFLKQAATKVHKRLARQGDGQLGQVGVAGYQGGGPERKACKRCWASCTSRSVAAAISAADMTSGAGDRGVEWAGDGLAVLARRTERDPRRDAGADGWPQNGFQTCSGSSQSLLSDEPGDVWQPDPGPLVGRLATPRGELDSEVRRGAMGASGTWSGWKTASCSFETRLATVGDSKIQNYNIADQENDENDDTKTALIRQGKRTRSAIMRSSVV